MNLYKNHSDRELVAVLENTSKLTYEAQLNLVKEFQKRSIHRDLSGLREEIHDKEAAIAGLEHLKDLGFQATVDDTAGTITVQRTTMATVMDVVSIVLGVILFMVGCIYCWLLLEIFFGDNVFSLSKLLGYGLMILAGGIGFKMLSGIHRLLDYRNFEVRTGQSKVTLTMKGDTTQYSPQDVSVVQYDEELILRLGEQEVFYANAQNLKQKLTIEALERKIKG